VVFEGVVGTSYTGDIALDDIEVSKRPCYYNSTGDCTFENGTFCGYTKTSENDFDWSIRKTSSSYWSSNRPRKDHTKGRTGQYGGYYIYISYSWSHVGKIAEIISPEIFGGQCVEFYYYMGSWNVGELNVYVDDGIKRIISWHLKGFQQTLWLKGMVPVEGNLTSFRVVFEGVMGSTYGSTIALDDIRILDTICHTFPSKAFVKPYNISSLTNRDERGGGWKRNWKEKEGMEEEGDARGGGMEEEGGGWKRRGWKRRWNEEEGMEEEVDGRGVRWKRRWMEEEVDGRGGGWREWKRSWMEEEVDGRGGGWKRRWMERGGRWKRRWMEEEVDGRGGGWKRRWMEEEVDGRGGGWKRRWMEEEVDGRGGGWKRRWMEEEVDGRGGGWKRRWMEEEVDGRGGGWKRRSMEEEVDGRGGGWKRRWMEEEVDGRGGGWKRRWMEEELDGRGASTARLHGSSKHWEGRAEVLIGGMWGTISDSGWDIFDADVFCRQAGFAGATGSFNNKQFTSGVGPVWISNTNCDGDEKSFWNCNYTRVFRTGSWYHNHDAGAECFGTTKAPTSTKAPTMTPSPKVPTKTPSPKVPTKTPSHKVSTKTPSHKVSTKTPSHKVSTKTPSPKVPTKNPSHKVSTKTPSHKWNRDTFSKGLAAQLNGYCKNHSACGLDSKFIASDVNILNYSNKTADHQLVLRFFVSKPHNRHMKSINKTITCTSIYNIGTLAGYRFKVLGQHVPPPKSQAATAKHRNIWQIIVPVVVVGFAVLLGVLVVAFVIRRRSDVMVYGRILITAVIGLIPLLGIVSKAGKNGNGSCTFERGRNLCGYRNLRGDNFDWTLSNAGYRYRYYLPRRDHTTGNGRFLYIKSQYFRRVRDKAQIISPIITGGKCVHFYYYMKGSGVGELNVYIDNRSNRTLLWQNVGPQSAVWIKAIIPITGLTTPFQIVFEGVIGGRYGADIALDDIQVFQKPCVYNYTGACTFEPGVFCGYTNEYDNAIKWILHQGRLSYGRIGPTADHTIRSVLKGKVIFEGTSGTYYMGRIALDDITIMKTPCKVYPPAADLAPMDIRNISNARLNGSSHDYEGRAEVQFAGMWGTISDSGWDIFDADVFCRQAGFAGTNVVAVSLEANMSQWNRGNFKVMLAKQLNQYCHTNHSCGYNRYFDAISRKTVSMYRYIRSSNIHFDASDVIIFKISSKMAGHVMLQFLVFDSHSRKPIASKFIDGMIDHDKTLAGFVVISHGGHVDHVVKKKAGPKVMMLIGITLAVLAVGAILIIIIVVYKRKRTRSLRSLVRYHVPSPPPEFDLSDEEDDPNEDARLLALDDDQAPLLPASTVVV
ncbi:hypothetical protein QZH41_011753, partial [Actinostola sp. cb2023]